MKQRILSQCLPTTVLDLCGPGKSRAMLKMFKVFELFKVFKMFEAFEMIDPGSLNKGSDRTLRTG